MEGLAILIVAWLGVALFIAVAAFLMTSFVEYVIPLLTTLLYGDDDSHGY